jgi:low affinity Fe/Cu permease
VTDETGRDDEVIVRRRQMVDGARQGTSWRQGLIGGSAEESPRPRAVRAHGDAWLERHWSSRTLHRVGETVAHAGAGLGAATAVMAWLVVGAVNGFPDWWETTLYATSSSVTLVMVFAIQHTQTRQDAAIQRKLDELLRAQPDADNKLIAVEEAPDQELEARATLNLADRQGEPSSGPARKPETSPGTP